MINTTPNKEIVRRITMLHGATFCYMLVSKGSSHVEIHANVVTNKISSCETELKEWSGMNFKVYNDYSEEKMRLKNKGIKILPIET